METKSPTYKDVQEANDVIKRFDEHKKIIREERARRTLKYRAFLSTKNRLESYKLYLEDYKNQLAKTLDEKKRCLLEYKDDEWMTKHWSEFYKECTETTRRRMFQCRRKIKEESNTSK